MRWLCKWNEKLFPVSFKATCHMMKYKKWLMKKRMWRRLIFFFTWRINDGMIKLDNSRLQQISTIQSSYPTFYMTYIANWRIWPMNLLWAKYGNTLIFIPNGILKKMVCTFVMTCWIIIHFLNSIPVKEELAASPSLVETAAAVKKLNNGWSPGLDDICADVLKYFSDCEWMAKKKCLKIFWFITSRPHRWHAWHHLCCLW